MIIIVCVTEIDYENDKVTSNGPMMSEHEFITYLIEMVSYKQTNETFIWRIWYDKGQLCPQFRLMFYCMIAIVY